MGICLSWTYPHNGLDAKTESPPKRGFGLNEPEFNANPSHLYLTCRYYNLHIKPANYLRQRQALGFEISMGAKHDHKDFPAEGWRQSGFALVQYAKHLPSSPEAGDHPPSGGGGRPTLGFDVTFELFESCSPKTPGEITPAPEGVLEPAPANILPCRPEFATGHALETVDQRGD